jgi:O-antigen ligase
MLHQLHQNKNWLYHSLIICAISTSIYDILLIIEHPNRHEGLLTEPITRGNMGMLFGLLSYVSFFAMTNKAWQYLAIIGFMSGVGLSILSGSRGGWLALPFVLLTSYFLVIQYTQFKRFFWIAVASIIVIVVALWSFLPIESRLFDMVRDIKAYMNGDTYTSLGARFEAWRASVYAFLDKPIMGWGVNSFDHYVVHYNNIELTKATTLGNAHSDIFHFLGSLGILGIVSFSLITIIPFYYLFVHLRDDNINLEKRILVLLGFTLIETMLEFSLSYQTFSMRYTFQLYVIVMFIILISLHHLNTNDNPTIQPQKQ